MLKHTTDANPIDDWEVVHEQSEPSPDPALAVELDRTERLRVPGGWLYWRVQELVETQGTVRTAAMVFVPDGRAMRRPDGD